MKRALTNYAPGQWRPGGKLANPMGSGPWMREREGSGESVLGISILSALSIAGIWASINPSYVAFRSFAAKPETKESAQEGIWIGLAASTAASVGILLVFRDWVPALISELTALTLFGVSMYAVNNPSAPATQQQTAAA